MKDSIAYIASFVFAFILVTAAVFILNEKYTNMFRLDFSPRMGEAAMADTLRKAGAKFGMQVNVDSISRAAQDSVTAAQANPDSAMATGQSTIAGTEHAADKSLTAEELKKNNNKQIAESKPAVAKPARMNDSSYIKWKRATLGIFETMDSKQIARLIIGYSDDVARDLIYSMKKKKAGEVLSLLTPEMFHRITRVQ